MVKMLPSCNMLLCLLVWVTAYGNTLTISSTVNSTEYISDPFTEKSINDACVKEEECSATLYCDMSVCQCASSNYWNGSTCSTKKDEKSYCNASMECKATLQCRNNHCICCNQDYWNGQFCERKRNMTYQCQESVQCQDTLYCIRGICQDICAAEQCMNGGKCQISENRHRCECVGGYLGDKCQYADGREKDFIVIFHEAYGGPSPRILPVANRRVELSIFYFANNKNVSVTITSVDNHYILDSNVLMTNGLHQAGAEIHSNFPITLHGFLFVRLYSEGFFVLPTRFTSKHYIIPSFTVHEPHKSFCQSVFVLSTVYSNTIIEINFKVKDGSVLYDNIQYSNNQTLMLVLNKYTVFQIQDTSDLSGTTIIASKPIVVVSGNRCNYINAKGSCQPFIEMVLPITQLDNVYIIPYLNNRLENTVRVLAVNDTTVLQKNGNQRTIKVLKSRHYLDYSHTTISYVSAASDMMIHIYPHELTHNHGDAFMMTIPGIHQYLNDYDFMVPTEFESFISITVPTDAVDGFVLDGNFLTLKNMFSISEEEYHFSSFSISISSGQHHITHREKARFGLWVYGNYTPQEAYGFPAGMAFKT